jgi:hypothetical protein
MFKQRFVVIVQIPTYPEEQVISTAAGEVGFGKRRSCSMIAAHADICAALIKWLARQ